MRELAAALVLLVLIALFACALLPDPDERKRKDALAEAERRKEERAKRVKELADELKSRKAHMFQRPWKPSFAYLAPERKEQEQEENVVQMKRRAKR